MTDTDTHADPYAAQADAGGDIIVELPPEPTTFTVSLHAEELDDGALGYTPDDPRLQGTGIAPAPKPLRLDIVDLGPPEGYPPEVRVLVKDILESLSGAGGILVSVSGVDVLREGSMEAQVLTIQSPDLETFRTGVREALALFRLPIIEDPRPLHILLAARDTNTALGDFPVLSPSEFPTHILLTRVQAFCAGVLGSWVL